MVSIKEASKVLGVSTRTLIRWEEEHKISSVRTKGGHRRYDVSTLLGVKHNGTESITIAYARVSSADQSEDLNRQKIVLEAYCAQKGYEFEIISDIGSGLNYRKRGLVKLISLLCSQKVERLILTHKDRLLRFGSELIFSLCEHFGTEVVILNKSECSTFEEDLTNDVLEIVNIFSARLYGSRNQKNKNIVETLQEACKNL